MDIPALQLKSLTKCYGGVAAVRDLTINVPAASIFGFLGPNGAGKSTTVRMMAGLIAPTSGDAKLMGKSILTEAIAVKRMVGVVPDGLALFEYLTISEHLGLVQAVFEIEDEIYRHRSAQLLDVLALTSEADKRVRECSYGVKKKTSLAMALLPNPKVLILDEPLEGLDPLISVTVKRALKGAAAKGITVFMTTHLLASASDLVDRYGILRNGTLVAHGDTATLSSKGLTLEDAYLREFEVPKGAGLEWLG